MKTCTKCGAPKALEEFHLHRGGRHPRCKDCVCAYHRERYDSLTGVEYNRLLLKRRRAKALARMRNRNNKED